MVLASEYFTPSASTPVELLTDSPSVIPWTPLPPVVISSPSTDITEFITHQIIILSAIGVGMILVLIILFGYLVYLDLNKQNPTPTAPTTEP